MTDERAGEIYVCKVYRCGIELMPAAVVEHFVQHHPGIAIETIERRMQKRDAK